MTVRVERRWGVPLIDGGTVRLPRLIGLSRALGLILTLAGGERRWGVPLIDGGTVRLPRLIGLSRALGLILTLAGGERRHGAF